jgi:hypothetical protein
MRMVTRQRIASSASVALTHESGEILKLVKDGSLKCVALLCKRSELVGNTVTAVDTPEITRKNEKMKGRRIAMNRDISGLPGVVEEELITRESL